MTVCVAVKVRDCLVFAADSAVSMVGTSPGGETVVTNVWNHGIKVFNLYRGLPLVAMTAGAGNFGNFSVTELVKYFRAEPMNDQNHSLDRSSYTIQEVANRAQAFFSRIASNEQLSTAPDFEFWIGGYGATQVQSEVWLYSVTNGAELVSNAAGPDDHQNVLWGGMSTAIIRLVHGIDASAAPLLTQHGVDPDVIDDVRANITTPLVDAAMPVQDAIDLADFLVDLTKRYHAFLPGADVVGGDTDIATVTRHEGFKWIARKHYYHPHLNRRDTDHVN